MSLADEECRPVAKGTSPLSKDEAGRLAHEIPNWILKEKSIERSLEFPDFRRAMEFVNMVADLAQKEDHHPDICINYNKVRLEFSTHKIGGLSGNDFIMAAKIDGLAAK